MPSNHLTIGFVRRGFSSSGGAEAYLKRLAAGVVEKGHQVRLYASKEWPADEWAFGPITRLAAGSATAFADEMEKLAPRSECDVLMSLERIWRCDVYRAGDGVHRAWLERRSADRGAVAKAQPHPEPQACGHARAGEIAFRGGRRRAASSRTRGW